MSDIEVKKEQDRLQKIVSEVHDKLSEFDGHSHAAAVNLLTTLFQHRSVHEQAIQQKKQQQAATALIRPS